MEAARIIAFFLFIAFIGISEVSVKKSGFWVTLVTLLISIILIVICYLGATFLVGLTEVA